MSMMEQINNSEINAWIENLKREKNVKVLNDVMMMMRTLKKSQLSSLDYSLASIMTLLTAVLVSFFGNFSVFMRENLF
jgi:hypothetical protein